MTNQILATLLVFLASASSKAAILLDSINVTFTEKNAFVTYNPLLPELPRNISSMVSCR